ncbi:hypothetical protein ACX3O0_08920 [Homoserinimonas sp. A447]
MSSIEDYEPSRDEQDAANSISKLLAKLPDQIEDYAKLAPLKPGLGSELAEDDAVLAPLPASQLVETCLVAAADCLMAIELLLVEDDGIFLYSFAQYPLLRAVIEASTQVLWLLGPDDRRLRVIRNLRARHAESRHDEVLYGAIPGVPARLDELGKKRADAERAARAAIADRLDIALKEYEKVQLSYSEIVRDGARHTGDDIGHTVTVWRLISGLAHPYTSRFNSHSIHHPLQEMEDGSVLSARLPSASTTLHALAAAQAMFADALELTTARLVPPQ